MCDKIRSHSGSSKMSRHEIAIPIDVGTVLPSERPAYGCDVDERRVSKNVIII